MPQITAQLYKLFFRKPRLAEETQRLNSNIGLIRKSLSKWQRKILLRIIDDKDLIYSMLLQESFEQGFRLGAMLTTELYESTGGVSGISPDAPPLSWNEEV